MAEATPILRLVDQHRRVSIPPEVLKALQLSPGSHVAFVIDGEGVHMRGVDLTLVKKRDAARP